MRKPQNKYPITLLEELKSINREKRVLIIKKIEMLLYSINI